MASIAEALAEGRDAPETIEHLRVLAAENEDVARTLLEEP